MSFLLSSRSTPFFLSSFSITIPPKSITQTFLSNKKKSLRNPKKHALFGNRKNSILWKTLLHSWDSSNYYYNNYFSTDKFMYPIICQLKSSYGPNSNPKNALDATVSLESIFSESESILPKTSLSSESESILPKTSLTSESESIFPEEPLSLESESILSKTYFSSELESVLPKNSLSLESELILPKKYVSLDSELVLPKYKYRMVMAYDGTDYAGWQIQKSELTVQHFIEEALFKISGQNRKKLSVVAAGRTDAGVHAEGQVVHFTTETPFPDLSKTHLSLNGVLPPTIRILQISSVSPSFHARYSPLGKIYHYRIQNTPFLNPFLRKYTLHVNQFLERGEMEEGAKFFEGVHDFSAFGNSSLVKERDPVREIFRFDLREEENGFRFEIEGTGFLYKQVRNMVGLLLAIGKGSVSSSSVPFLLRAADRKKVARISSTVPPNGLSLVSVQYPEFFLKSPEGLPPPSLGTSFFNFSGNEREEKMGRREGGGGRKVFVVSDDLEVKVEVRK